MINPFSKFLLVLILVTGFWHLTYGQPARFSAEPGPVVEGLNGPLVNAWAGGLNASQMTFCNLNNDGIKDLFVFERIGNRVMTFLGQRNANGISYQYAPWYEQQFPRIDYWAQMHDFDCDGIEDLYMSDPFGVRVFKTVGTGRNLNFIPQGNYLSTKGFSGNMVNLQVNYADQPLIRDLDGDGDLDMLSITFGGSTIEFNRNVSKDSTGQCGLQYQKASACWGGLFLANTCGAFTFGACRNGALPEAIVRQDQTTGPDQRPMHMGTTIEVADFNGDGIKDLMTGDIGCTELYAFPNSGTALAPRFANTVSGFPTTSVPAQFFSFLGAKSLDIDGDGDDDLLVMPNIEKNENFLSDLTASCWLYENRGSNQAPNYQISTRSFLQSTMLDLGESAFPAFADADGDGDQDLFVGHAAKRNGTNYSSSIWYFENIGNAQLAHFVLRSQDYLGLSATGQLMLRPGFGDINADGLTDFYYTGTDITQRQSFSGYLINQGGAGLNFTGASWQNFQLSNNFGVLDSPVFTDLTTDGLPDMLVGKADGTLAFYINTGVANQPAFTLNNTNWGDLNVPYGYTLSLALGDMNADGIQDLVTGDETGFLRVYYNIQQQGVNPSLSADTTIMRDLIDNVNSQWYMGRHVVPAIANLTGDSRADLVIGQRGGGLLYLENVSNAPTSTDDISYKQLDLVVSPNPAQSAVRLGSALGRPFSFRLQTMTGHVITESTKLQTQYDVKLDAALAAGLYIVQATTADGTTATRRVVIIK